MNISQNKIKIELLIILIIIYYFSFLSQQIWIGKDHAEYLLLGRSLASGKGYIDHYLAVPKIDLRYPPGYPFILSLLIMAFGKNLLILRISNILLIGLSLFILNKITCKYLRAKEKFLVLILFAFNAYHLVFVAHTINSDVAYFLFSWLVILSFMDNKNTLSINKILLGMLFIITAFYMRAIGVSLYLALIIYLLLCKKYRQALMVFLFGGLLIFPWLFYVLIKQAGYSPELWGASAKFLDIILRPFFSLKYYFGKIVANLLFFPYFYRETFGSPLFAFKIILSLFFSLLFLRGFYLSVKKEIKFLDIYVFVYFFLILLWPIHSERLLLPIYPFLLGYLFIALREVRFNLLKAPIILSLFIAVIMANFNLMKNLINKYPIHKPPCITQSFPWLKAHTLPEAIVMSEDPAGIYFYTQRKGIRFDLSKEPQESLAKIKDARVNYIMLQKESGLTLRGMSINTFDMYMKPLLEKYPLYFNLVYRGRDKCGLLIYKVDIPVKQ